MSEVGQAGIANSPGNPQDCSSLRLSTKYLYCLLPRSPPASSLHKSPVSGAFPLSAGRCFRSTTRLRFPAPRRIPALIFSRNTASDQDEENSKQENLTLLSAKQSHFIRDSKANITMLIVGYPREAFWLWRQPEPDLPGGPYPYRGREAWCCEDLSDTLLMPCGRTRPCGNRATTV